MDLLTTYALAVDHMRKMQKGLNAESHPSMRELTAQAEREVDQLTTLHLLPPIPGPEQPAPVEVNAEVK